MDINKLSQLKNCTLLIVEDDKELVKNIKVTMELFFGTVLVAENGSEALKIFQKSPIDVVLTDFVMPIMDGHTLCTEIRKLDRNTPLIIMSNYSEKEKLLKVIPLNLIAYITKPITFDEITSVLLSVIERLERDNLLRFFISKDLEFDRISKVLYKDKTMIKLAKSESIILELFIKHKGSVITDEMIDDELNSVDPLSYKAIKNLVYRLRQKIGKNLIANVQSTGYIFIGKKND